MNTVEDEDESANPEMIAKITGAKEILKPKLGSRFRTLNFVEGDRSYE